MAKIAGRGVTAKLTGTVVDAAGRPAEGASVRLHKGRKSLEKTTVDAEGLFDFTGVSGDGTYTVTVLLGREEVASEKVVVKNARARPIEIRLRVRVPVAAGSTAPSTPNEGTTMNNPNPTGGGASTGTTAPPPPAPPPPPPPAAGADEVDFLVQFVSDIEFDIVPPVNIEEATQFRRLFTVGNYVLAKVPASISALDTLLKTPNNGAAITIINQRGLITKHSAAISSILQRLDEGFNNETELLKEVRRQFDLGTQPTTGINSNFKTLYRQFVGLCADDLLGVDPQVAEGRASFDDRQGEEIRNFLKRLKRSIIQVMESMSVAGTHGTNTIVIKWSKIVNDALVVLLDVSKNHVASDDADQRHIWSVIAALNRRPKSEIDGYLVAAREGAELLSYAIAIYDRMRSNGTLSNETPEFLRDLFYKQGEVFQGITVAERLKRNASFVLENWIPGWA